MYKLDLEHKEFSDGELMSLELLRMQVAALDDNGSAVALALTVISRCLVDEQGNYIDRKKAEDYLLNKANREEIAGYLAEFPEKWMKFIERMNNG